MRILKKKSTWVKRLIKVMLNGQIYQNLWDYIKSIALDLFTLTKCLQKKKKNSGLVDYNINKAFQAAFNQC